MKSILTITILIIVVSCAKHEATIDYLPILNKYWVCDSIITNENNFSFTTVLGRGKGYDIMIVPGLLTIYGPVEEKFVVHAGRLDRIYFAKPGVSRFEGDYYIILLLENNKLILRKTENGSDKIIDSYYSWP